jgi:hypothetical protein
MKGDLWSNDANPTSSTDIMYNTNLNIINDTDELLIDTNHKKNNFWNIPLE